MALNGKVALVTGASRGIGKGVALQLGEAGATVYITGRSSSGNALSNTAEEIGKRGGKAVPVACDHSKDEEIGQLFDQIERDEGRLDILVNNAYSAVDALYSNFGRPFWKIDASIWDECNLVGLRNNYLCAVRAAKIMTRQKSGLIVNISTGCSRNFCLTPAYTIVKAAKDRMAADCALELKAHNVAFISLWPGPVRTEAMVAAAGEEYQPASLETMDIGLNKYVIESASWKGESPEFSGKCVVAMAKDANLIQKSGAALCTADLGKEYGLLDIDGTEVEKTIFEM